MARIDADRSISVVASDAIPEPVTPSARQAQINPSPVVTPDRAAHILANHGALSLVDPQSGQFSPEFSTPAGLQKLALDVFERASTADIGAARHGAVALTGKLYDLDTRTGKLTPHEGRHSDTGRSAHQLCRDHSQSRQHRADYDIRQLRNQLSFSRNRQTSACLDEQSISCRNTDLGSRSNEHLENQQALY